MQLWHWLRVVTLWALVSGLSDVLYCPRFMPYKVQTHTQTAQTCIQMQHIKGKAVLIEYGSAWVCHNCRCLNVHWDHDVHKSPWCLHIYLPPLLSTDRHWWQQCSCVFVGLHVCPLAHSLLQTVFMRMYVLNVWVLKASISSQCEGELVSETSHQCLRCSMLLIDHAVVLSSLRNL